MHVTAVTYNGWHSLTIHSVASLDGGHAQPQGQSVLFFFPVSKRICTKAREAEMLINWAN